MFGSVLQANTPGKGKLKGRQLVLKGAVIHWAKLSLWFFEASEPKTVAADDHHRLAIACRAHKFQQGNARRLDWWMCFGIVYSADIVVKDEPDLNNREDYRSLNHYGSE